MSDTSANRALLTPSQFMEKDVHDKLFIKLQSSFDSDTVYSIQLLELPQTTLAIPERLVYPVCVSINSQMLSRTLRDMEHVSATYVKFQATGNTLTLTSLNSNSDDVGHVKQQSTFRSTPPQEAFGEADSGRDVVVQEEGQSATQTYSGTFLLKYLTYVSLIGILPRLETTDSRSSRDIFRFQIQQRSFSETNGRSAWITRSAQWYVSASLAAFQKPASNASLQGYLRFLVTPAALPAS